MRKAEDAWDTRGPAEVLRWPTTLIGRWRNRSEFVTGREEIVALLTRKWARELQYRLIKELWGLHENRIAVRFQYESCDKEGQWWRSYGDEQWEFDENGLMHAGAKPQSTT